MNRKPIPAIVYACFPCVLCVFNTCALRCKVSVIVALLKLYIGLINYTINQVSIKNIYFHNKMGKLWYMIHLLGLKYTNLTVFET